jgi:tRNA(Arg) A34 adenosine deaminase TadA
LNIHAAVLDNVDGEVLALDRNTIHSDASPLQHGEQRTIRTAIAKVTMKRPRQPSQAIEG